jgi:hypothetical protein
MECFGASVGHATQDYNTGFGRRAVVRVGALVGSGWLHGMVVRFRVPVCAPCVSRVSPGSTGVFLPVLFIGCASCREGNLT